jgi:gamma-glutamyltranspeptidase/glutathione hydrolase
MALFKKFFYTHTGEKREAPEQEKYLCRKTFKHYQNGDAEQDALKKGKTQKPSCRIDRFYKGDIAKEFVRGCQEQGGLIHMEDLGKWKVMIEEPLKVNYKGIDVYKLQQWTQGPALLQALNILENFDLKSMGYNSSRYINTLYQSMSLAFADRDFYYGDPYFPPEEPMKGLLDKAYAKQRASLINPEKNDPNIGPGDPYPFEGKVNPYLNILKQRGFSFDSTNNKPGFVPAHDVRNVAVADEAYMQRFRLAPRL